MFRSGLGKISRSEQKICMITFHLNFSFAAGWDFPHKRSLWQFVRRFADEAASVSTSLLRRKRRDHDKTVLTEPVPIANQSEKRDICSARRNARVTPVAEYGLLLNLSLLGLRRRCYINNVATNTGTRRLAKSRRVLPARCRKFTSLILRNRCALSPTFSDSRAATALGRAICSRLSTQDSSI